MTDPDRDRLLDEHAEPHAGLIEEADKVGAAGWTKTKHARRIIPVERIAPEADLDALSKKLVDEHFPEIPPGERKDPLPSFRVHYEEHSPAMHLHATDVMRRVADFVPKDSYRVDLESPERTILVVVAGGSALMSVVKGYGMSEKYHHFHIHSAADLGPPSTVSA
jgi:tRNA(Ser,Leu) C12 N-acetylase TAN1